MFVDMTLAWFGRSTQKSARGAIFFRTADYGRRILTRDYCHVDTTKDRYSFILLWRRYFEFRCRSSVHYRLF